MVHDAVLDVRGLLCPLPVLKLRKRLASFSDEAVIKVLVDDPAARVDIPYFCTEMGYELLGEAEEAAHLVFWVGKSKKS